MLNVTLIREHTELVERALAKRGLQVDLAQFLRLDEEFRRTRTAVENLRAERKQRSAEVARLLRTGQDVTALRVRSTAVGVDLDELETQLAELGTARRNFLDQLPNLPDDDVVAGGKENNEVLRSVGAPPQFAFPAGDHVELAQRLGLIDYERGVKLGGSGHWIYRGNGALLEWALLNFFVQTHLRDGYEFVLPPHLLTYEAGYTAGQFPKFADEVFAIEPAAPGKPGEPAEAGPRRFLLPTSETALVNLHRDETLSEEELPRKYFAYSPCYRKEIGGYRATERGTLRGHQFDKVELFQFVRPDASDAAHEELLAKAEQLVSALGLHYRITRLAAEDTSAAMAKTFDVEVWLPSINAYVEVSSVSNARDYQARRGNIRYRPTGGRPAFVHTLNASGLATSRLLPAILEQHQQPDGTVVVPEVLRPWLGTEVLAP
ncbi:serine--tRNA ligase [Kitasatospora atroaurantiaca]|uniref:Serine--tRNA ligase n=1 Tax=Kitasatospora atroaurantiaca TaxID=285545 RepID=A0A561EL87_9ACTN|nr:serine--tRNA ligase [Kitasatospora atroaurantiaca]TWE16385.1 seryl-tRNA synthetase [Kitasatospora atroaurantiaca]